MKTKAKLNLIKCDSCGHIRTNEDWEENPICPMCSGAYVTAVANQKCGCDTCINQKQSKKKVDGRKMVISAGVFPYRLKEACRRSTIERFLSAGHSVHSEGAHTLGVIIEHCIRENIPFTLNKIMNGYYIEIIGHA